MSITNQHNTMTTIFANSKKGKNLFTKKTNIKVDFLDQDGVSETATIEFFETMFDPFYYDVPNNQAGWMIIYSEWFMDGKGSSTEQTELGEIVEVGAGIYEADDGNYGKIRFTLV